MSHYNIVMDEYRHKKNEERAGEMKIMQKWKTFF